MIAGTRPETLKHPPPHTEVAARTGRTDAVAAAGRTGATADSDAYDVSIVIPALNEAEAIQATIASVPFARFHELGRSVEIVVVDNGSTDGTAALAARAGARVVNEPRRGYGNAYRTGFAAARGSIICTMDADGTYPAQALPDLVEALTSRDLEFISTERFSLMSDGAMSGVNRLGNSLLSSAARVAFGIPFRDSQSGMWVFHRRLLPRMDLRSTGMSFSEEIKIEAAWALHARCAEYPIKYGRRTGRSKLRLWRDGFLNLGHLARHRFRP